MLCFCDGRSAMSNTLTVAMEGGTLRLDIMRYTVFSLCADHIENLPRFVFDDDLFVRWLF